jgi:S1-C subfamily serine protease
MVFPSFTLAFFLFTPLFQDRPDDRIQRILERIDKEIRESQARLRDEIVQIIRAELQKGPAAKTPPPAPRPQDPDRKRPYLGIVVDDLSDQERQALGVAGGIRIAEVRGPAEKAGLKPGDILLELDGAPATEDRIGALLDQHKPGDEVSAVVFRSRQKQTLKVVLGERKE